MPWPRTVAGVLWTLGMADEPGFCKYHRVLSRARWSGLRGAKILLGLLVAVATSQGHPLTILVDETVERRKGRKIKAEGDFPPLERWNFLSRSCARLVDG